MFGKNIRKIIQQHIDKHGSDNTVVLVMSYDDDLLLATRTAIQKLAPIKVELLTFPHVYNELDTEKMIRQINEAKPTLIINAASKEWVEENLIDKNANIVLAVSESNLRFLICAKRTMPTHKTVIPPTHFEA